MKDKDETRSYYPPLRGVIENFLDPKKSLRHLVIVSVAIVVICLVIAITDSASADAGAFMVIGIVFTSPLWLYWITGRRRT